MRSLSLLIVPLLASASPILAQESKPVPVSTLVDQVRIPYEQFTLANGLRVIVHTDRKAPIVGVTVYYDVGSKMEPKGKTGFAHLFEHLMFGGSENVPNYDEPLVAAGSTPTNGSTAFDRTNYVETVPTGALELALFMESDRMGHLLGAVNQEKLDAQRGVVQNEKRQGDNQPFGLVEYAQLAGTLPPDHPYGHSTIGSMADLDAASLDDVKGWFRQHYGPNNAILVLAGDIDAKTARPLVEKYFGDIPAGPKEGPVAVSIPTLAKAKSETMTDQVATTRLYRMWTVPGLNDVDAIPLDIGATVLGGLASSRLDNALVRKERLAVQVSADVQLNAQLGWFTVQMDVRPGVDPAVAAARLDAVIADMVKTGPTADEVQRTAVRQLAARIAGLEEVGSFGGKGATLAEGLLYSGDPAHYRKELAGYANTTPAQVQAALAKWLSRPVYALAVKPGERASYGEASVGATPAARYYRGPDGQGGGASAAPVDRSKLPAVAPVRDFKFPDVKRATLSNGITLVYAQRNAVPITQIVIAFDAGVAADPKDRPGTQSLMLALLDEGTTTRDSIGIAEEEERLGANFGGGATMDQTRLSMFALSANLDPSLDLMADLIRNPAFDPAEVERLRNQQLARIAAELSSPAALANRTLPPMLFGKDHPYGRPLGGAGDPAVVRTLSREELIAFHKAWIRPDKATIFVVSDRPIEEVGRALEKRFGNWSPSGPAGTKNFDAPVPAASPRILLVDRPNSPQSYILGGEVTPLKGSDDLTATLVANNVLGDDFLSRLNVDLRETKGWSYGVAGRLNRFSGPVSYLVVAPVQADKTGAAIAALRADISAFVTTSGVTAAERDRTVEGSVRELPSSFETGAAILAGMQNNVLYKRPDDFYSSSTTRYRALTVTALDAAARKAIDPKALTWVIVGDAKTVRPQLDSLGLPVEVVAAPSAQ